MSAEGEAHFAGTTIFKDGEFLKECSVDAEHVAINAYKLAGSFLVNRNGDYLFMDGRITGPVRWVLIDSSPEQYNNAMSLHVLGVPIVSVEEAQKNYVDSGVPMLNVTT